MPEVFEKRCQHGGYLPVIANLVETICEGNKEVEVSGPFDGLCKLGVREYLGRLSKYGGCGKEVFVCMLLLVGQATEEALVLQHRNVHKLLLTAFVVAVKVREDYYHSNAYYASIGGVSLDELNILEAAFLQTVDWNIEIPSQRYQTMLVLIEKCTTLRA